MVVAPTQGFANRDPSRWPVLWRSGSAHGVPCASILLTGMSVLKRRPTLRKSLLCLADWRHGGTKATVGVRHAHRSACSFSILRQAGRDPHILSAEGHGPVRGPAHGGAELRHRALPAPRPVFRRGLSTPGIPPGGRAGFPISPRPRGRPSAGVKPKTREGPGPEGRVQRPWRHGRSGSSVNAGTRLSGSAGALQPLENHNGKEYGNDTGNRRLL